MKWGVEEGGEAGVAVKEHRGTPPRGDDHVPYPDCIHVNIPVLIRDTVSQSVTVSGNCYLGPLCLTSLNLISIYDYLKIKKKKRN